jgi:hypothetical protein
MAAIENRSAVVPAVIVGLCLVVGLAIGGTSSARAPRASDQTFESSR